MYSAVRRAGCGDEPVFIDNNQDNQVMDPLTRDLVTERDRLHKMTFYCFTNECLRDYILRYFGEYGANTAKIRQYRMDENPHYGEAFLEKVIEFNKEYGKTDAPESLGVVEFSSLDYDVLQDYAGNAGKSLL